jgi:hypothetical protein
MKTILGLVFTIILFVSYDMAYPCCEAYTECEIQLEKNVNQVEIVPQNNPPQHFNRNTAFGYD